MLFSHFNLPFLTSEQSTFLYAKWLFRFPLLIASSYCQAIFYRVVFFKRLVCRNPLDSLDINSYQLLFDLTITQKQHYQENQLKDECAAAAAAESLQSCPTLRPHRRQPTRLRHPWDSPGKNTGVGCHFLLQCMKVKVKVKSLSRVQLLATPQTAPYQAPASMGFSRQEYWSGLALCSLLKMGTFNQTIFIDFSRGPGLYFLNGFISHGLGQHMQTDV